MAAVQNNHPIADNETDVVRKAAHGVAWNYLSFGLGKLLVFVTTAILARLLTPEDFGIIGFATIAISYLDIAKDIGLGPALIQRKDNIEEAANTVFTMNLIVSIALSVFAFLLAPLVADFFREPLVVPVLRVLGLSFILNALGAVHTVRLQKELDFRRKLIPDIARSLLKGITAIILAYFGFGVWSLVIGQLVGPITGSTLSWIVFPWRPRLAINSRVAKQLLKFGTSVFGDDALSIISDNLDYIIVGRIFGSTALGIYTQAYRLPELLIINTLWVIGAVIFPVFSSIQDNLESLRQGFLGTVRLVEIFAVPLSLGLIIAADPIIRVAFGDQWLDAIPILRVLAAYALVLSFGFHSGGVYKAIGRPEISLKLSLFTLVILAPALWVGSRYGLVGIALGHIVAVLIRAIARLVIIARFIQLPLKSIFNQLAPALLGGITLTILAVPTLLLTQSTAPIVQLLLVGTAGAAGYIVALWFFERNTILRFARIIGVPVFGKELEDARP
jgi:PST family polysaccharide transporter